MLPLQEWWEQTDEKPAVVATGVIGFVILWALSGLVDRVDRLPFLGGFFELVGLVVTGWFTYRYLTFAPDRFGALLLHLCSLPSMCCCI